MKPLQIAVVIAASVWFTNLGQGYADTTHKQEITIKVTEKGFEPARVRVKSGQPLRLTVIRTTDRTCATQIVFPALNLQQKLPLNQPQTIEIPPNQTAKAGTLSFACNMDMLAGEIVLE